MTVRLPSDDGERLDPPRRERGPTRTAATTPPSRPADSLPARILESSRDCIEVLDLDARLVSLNAGGMEALEICDLGDVVGRSWIDFWQGEDRERARQAVEAARTGGVGRFVGFFATTQTRKPRYWDVVVSPILDDAGAPEGFLASSRDVTEFARADARLRAIAEGTASATGAGFFRSLVRHLASALDVRYAFVTECQKGNRARTLAFWQGATFGADFEYDVRGTPCKTVLEGQRSFHPRQLQRLFPDDADLAALGAESYLGVPLLDSSQRVIGHLAVLDEVPMEETLVEVPVLSVFAARAGAELERLKSGERQRTLLEINNAIIANLTRDALFHAIVQALRRIVRVDRTSLALHQPDRDALRLVAVESSVPSEHFAVGVEVPVGRSHIGEAFREQRSLLRRDLATDRRYPFEDRLFADGFRSILIVPLIVRGRSIGTLNVASLAANEYSDADAALLQEVGAQFALAVQNMVAYEEIAALKAKLQEENVYLQEEIRREHNFEEIVGSSPALIGALHGVERVAPTDATVLIHGETGTGKELVARAIHSRSPRGDRPLVKVNCGAIPAGLVESELFGHVKGAFTGAIGNRVGRFELADGGTVFLDEVSELPLETQVKLLRVLQEREFEPVGSSRTRRVDVRIVAATNRDLEEAVRAGRFRADLYFRLNVLSVRVPPLRERRSDIPQLVTFFLARLAKQFGKTIHAVSQETLKRLVDYPWPGNVRELQNVIERAVIMAEGGVLALGPDPLPLAPASDVTGEDVGPPTSAIAPPAGVAPSELSLEEVERRHIRRVLEQTSGVIEGPSGAAQRLGLHPNTLRSRMRKLGVQRPAGPAPPPAS